MSERAVDATKYPLAWDESYSRKGPQWRGGLRITPYLSRMDLSGPIIELGVGNGNTAIQIAIALPKRTQLVCIDASRRALARLPAQLQSDMRVSPVVADAREMPFQDGAYSAVFARHVLTHTIAGDEGRMLSEMCRLLRPGCSALIEVFGPGDMRFGKGEEIYPNVFLRSDGLVWRFFSEKELRSATTNARMEVVLLETVSRQVTHLGKKYHRESLVAVARRI